MSIEETFTCVVADSTKKSIVKKFLVEVTSPLSFVMQHLTHINNISVLFVVCPFESANNMFVDEI